MAFFDPEGIVGSNLVFLSPTLTGSVRATPDGLDSDVGGLFIDFDNTPILFTFNEPCTRHFGDHSPPTICASGQFYFTINDLAISPSHIASISGQITGAEQHNPVPEPATLLLLGTGLAGLAGRARRRRTGARRIAASGVAGGPAGQDPSPPCQAR